MGWILLFGGIYIGGMIAAVAAAFKMSKFGFIKKLAKDKKRWAVLISLLIMAALMTVLVLTINAMNAVIVFLHLIVFWLLADLVNSIVRKKRGKAPKRYYAGAIAIVFTAVYLCIGAYLDFHVFETQYDVGTDKKVGHIRVAMIADSHVGTTFDGDRFAEHLKEIEKTEPDILVVAGDFVDDSTTKEDMIRSCEALGNVKTKYGVYVSFGNHDKGYMNSRGYSGNDVIAELEKNGVHVLHDEAMLIDGRFYVIGRKDRSEQQRGGGRASMEALISGLDTSKYMIVIDHQPHDYDAQAAAGVDLVLSGHTHGGQVFPANILEALFHADDRVYGHEKRNNTDFIVTSGISDWEIIFKTCTYSEYVIVDVREKRKDQ